MPSDTRIAFHYTSGVALKSIVDGGVLWASSPRLMNDRHEFSYGRDLMKELAAGDVEQYKLDGDSRSLLNWILTKIQESNIPQTMFVVSASTEGDLLNQWAHYTGDHGYGYAIALDMDEKLFPDGMELLPNARQQHPLTSWVTSGWYPVEYDRATQLRRIVDLINASTPASIGLSSPPAWEIRLETDLLRMMCTFKHSGFSAEREVRFLADFSHYADHADRSLRGIEYHIGELGLIPHLNLRLSKAKSGEGSDGALPIVGLVVGPSSPTNDEIRRQIATDYMHSKGYPIRAQSSDIPFRTGR